MNKTSDKEKLIMLFYKKIDYYKNLANKDESISDRLIRREIQISLLEILQEFIIDESDYIPKSKIKEKILELDNGTYDAKIILQNLLEEK